MQAAEFEPSKLVQRMVSNQWLPVKLLCGIISYQATDVSVRS